MPPYSLFNKAFDWEWVNEWQTRFYDITSTGSYKLIIFPFFVVVVVVNQCLHQQPKNKQKAQNY